jgi:molybdopterin/thiamine biosynthesis adenylyltransferase
MESDRNITTSILEDIQNRQKGLVEDFSGKCALIIGLGGIGNWIALDLALIGVGTLILYDNDKIEASNLNRTLFKLSQIGEYKTKACKDLIAERRKDTIVITFEEKFTSDDLKKFDGIDSIFDCSDTTKLKDSISEVKRRPDYIKLGYDGFDSTICINDFESGKWGEDSDYTITPSLFATPQIISALAVTEMLLVRRHPKRTVNFNIKNILNQISENEK